MKAILTVIGKDKVGIISSVCSLLSEQNVNILDINQTILQDVLTMFMVVDVSASKLSFGDLAAHLEKLGEDIGLTIRIQRQDIFDAMHRI